MTTPYPYTSGLPTPQFVTGYDRRHDAGVPANMADVEDIQEGDRNSAAEDAAELAVNTMRTPANPGGTRYANGPL